LRYLRDLAIRLYGRSGVGMSGALPLSYSTLADFVTVTDTDLSPWEADVLMACDATIHAALTRDG
jgi:hypothetical protein